METESLFISLASKRTRTGKELALTACNLRMNG